MRIWALRLSSLCGFGQALSSLWDAGLHLQNSDNNDIFLTGKQSVQSSHSVVSDSWRPHGLQHARPPCPSTNSWSLLKLMSIELVMPSNHLILCHPLLLPPSIRAGLSEIILPKLSARDKDVVVLATQSCPTLYDTMNYSPPGSSVHRILQPRVLELPFPSPGDPLGLLLCRRILYHPSHQKSPW